MLALGLLQMHGERLRHRRFRLLGGDPAELRHAGQHPIAPRLRRLVMAQRVVVVRRFRQCRDERGLRKRQLVERLLEIGVGRRGNPVSAGAEIDLVQINFEDAFLAQLVLDAVGEQRLLDLARDRDLVAEQEMPHDLLGDRRGADRPLAALKTRDVGDRGAEDGNRVDPVMRIEIAVLGGQNRLDQCPRHLADRHDDAVFAGEFGHEPAVAGIHLGAGRRHIGGKLLMVRQIASEIDQRNADKAADPDRADDDDQEGDARHPAQDFAHWRRTGQPLWPGALRGTETLQPGIGSAMVSLPG